MAADPYAALRERYPAIVSAEQVAEMLSLNIRTVYAMASDGRMPASRLPGTRKFHFRLEEIIELLERHRVEPTAATEAPSSPEPPPDEPVPARARRPKTPRTPQAGAAAPGETSRGRRRTRGGETTGPT